MSQHANDQAADMPGEDQPNRRVTVEEAARLLGLSGNAVRKRLERGSLRSEKVDGVRYVLLEDDMPQHANDVPYGMPGDIALMQAHLDSMSEQINYLKEIIERRDEEIRRKDHLLAAALERIPAIEAPPDTPSHEPSRDERESPVTASEDMDRSWRPTEPQKPLAEEPPKQRPWWRRWFGN